MPFTDQFGISRKIDENKERQRLRKILCELDVPDGMGIIIRTAGEGMKSRFFVRDLAILLERWQKISADLESTKAPALLLEEPDIVERTVRDFLTEDIDRIVVDDLETSERMKKLVGAISKRSEKKVIFHQENVPVFEKYQVNKQVENAFRRLVWLRSGAYLVIDETEALVAIDVNTGRNKGGSDTDNTIFNTNLEAAEEVSRQLRLRNIGGLIIVDFIDMKSRKDQNEVVRQFKEHLKRDKAKTPVLPISPLGIMEMTRQRVQESISRSLYMECPACKGRGMVKTPETMSVEIQREISRILGKYQDTHDLKIMLHPKVLDRLRTEDEQLLVDLERKFACKLVFKSDHNFHFEEYKITHGETGEELK
jgi:ribonuclease G